MAPLFRVLRHYSQYRTDTFEFEALDEDEAREDYYEHEPIDEDWGDEDTDDIVVTCLDEEDPPPRRRLRSPLATTRPTRQHRLAPSRLP